LGVRAFSTSCVARKNISSTDLVVFSDGDKDKLDILKYIKGKSGIYMWTNKLNSKKYVGSSSPPFFCVRKKREGMIIRGRGGSQAPAPPPEVLPGGEGA